MPLSSRARSALSMAATAGRGIGCGTVFELTPAGPGYTFHEVYRFTGPPDGAESDNSGLASGPPGL